MTEKNDILHTTTSVYSLDSSTSDVTKTEKKSNRKVLGRILDHFAPGIQTEKGQKTCYGLLAFNKNNANKYMVFLNMPFYTFFVYFLFFKIWIAALTWTNLKTVYFNNPASSIWCSLFCIFKTFFTFSHISIFSFFIIFSLLHFSDYQWYLSLLNKSFKLFAERKNENEILKAVVKVTYWLFINLKIGKAKGSLATGYLFGEDSPNS